MKLSIMSVARSFLLLSIGVVLLASLLACHRPGEQDVRKDIEVTAKTKYSGTINGTPISIDVLATINTGRGGRSSCTFTSIPTGFNPATLGTMA
jgi:hypothetical protein